ncbi:MAG TPA: endonuclease/exonuclease/phosphatase family protein [Chitinophagaceae bacterium]|nr:endonuclease/exonuclease/phosphatase family protein [Chitinophagaceae bacterium]
MATRFRIFTQRIFIFINLVLVFLLLLSCLVPYLDPRTWWFIAFLGLAFPFLLLFNFIFIIGWFAVLRPRYTLISVIALLVSIKSITDFFAFQSNKRFDYTRQPGTLRVVSWNVARFVELKRNNNEGSRKRLQMFELLRQQNADVLCLQEFHTSTDSNYYNNIKPIQDLGYPYYYFSFDEDGDRHYYSSIIFSRYPFADTGRIRYPRPTLPDVLMYADIKLNKDTIRVYTTHLQSLQLGKKDYERLREIKNANDSLLSNSRTILGKMKKAFSHRSIQADLVHEVMSNSPHPSLLGIDMNDVPNSYAYNTIKGSMQDAFLKKGFGIGRTFAALSPTLRIDYIFTDRHFTVKQFNRIVKNLSDHYMLLADVELKK